MPGFRPFGRMGRALGRAPSVATRTAASGVWRIKLWGGAGGAGSSRPSDTIAGYVVDVPLADGDTLDLYIGQGGIMGGQGTTPDPAGGNGGPPGASNGSPNTAGGGGARSSLYLRGSLLLVSAGSPGGGIAYNGSGGHATDTAAGAAGGNGSAGSGPNGGAGGPAANNTDNPGGGGSGGRWGGGGGGCGSSTNSAPSQAGGYGSSFVSPLCTLVGSAAAASSEYGYVAGVALGVAASSSVRGGSGEAFFISPSGETATFLYTGARVGLLVRQGRIFQI